MLSNINFHINNIDIYMKELLLLSFLPLYYIVALERELLNILNISFSYF